MKEGHIIKEHIGGQKKSQIVADLQKMLGYETPYPIMLRLFFANVRNPRRIIHLYEKGKLTFSDIRYLGCCSAAKQRKIIQAKMYRKGTSSKDATIHSMELIVNDMNKMIDIYNKETGSSMDYYKTPSALYNIRHVRKGRKNNIPNHNYYEDMDMVVDNPQHLANYESYRKISQ